MVTKADRDDFDKLWEETLNLCAVYGRRAVLDLIATSFDVDAQMLDDEGATDRAEKCRADAIALNEVIGKIHFVGLGEEGS